MWKKERIFPDEALQHFQGFLGSQADAISVFQGDSPPAGELSPPFCTMILLISTVKSPCEGSFPQGTQGLRVYQFFVWWATRLQHAHMAARTINLQPAQVIFSDPTFAADLGFDIASGFEAPQAYNYTAAVSPALAPSPLSTAARYPSRGRPFKSSLMVCRRSWPLS